VAYDKKSFILGLATGLATRGVLCNPAKEQQQEGAYLTFSSPEPFTLAVYNAKKNWDGALEYSTDTKNWTVWDGTTTLASETRNSLYLRGNGNTVITGDSADYRWMLTGSAISCEGDIRTLLNFNDPDNSVMASYCFGYMFQGNTNLVCAPELPATKLASHCYRRMFGECSNLVSAPELPATTLSDSCYNYMFIGCANLVSAPVLPATTLTPYCYNGMFYGCTSLISAPALPATTLAYMCYTYMFRGCVSLIGIPALFATTLTPYCYSGMFYDCTKIRLSTTQTGEYQTPYRIPITGTGTIASGAVSMMFRGTGGTFTGTPKINTTYYTSNEVV